MIEIRTHLRDGSIVTDLTEGPVTSSVIEQEFEDVRELFGEPYAIELLPAEQDRQ